MCYEIGRRKIREGLDVSIVFSFDYSMIFTLIQVHPHPAGVSRERGRGVKKQRRGEEK